MIQDELLRRNEKDLWLQLMSLETSRVRGELGEVEFLERELALVRELRKTQAMLQGRGLQSQCELLVG